LGKPNRFLRVVVQILTRHIVFRYFLSSDFFPARVVGPFPADYSGFEGVPFVEQFVYAL
jgi:hypothetical protein